MDSQRSNTSTRLRKHAATVFSVNALDMSPSTTRQEKFRDMIGCQLDHQSTWPRIVFPIEGRNPAQGLQRGVRQNEGVFEYKVNGSACSTWMFNTERIQFSFVYSLNIFFSFSFLLFVGRTRLLRWSKEISGYAQWLKPWKWFTGSATLLLVQLPRRLCSWVFSLSFTSADYSWA